MNDLVPMHDLQTMASAIAKSGLFGAKTPEQALALMLVAQAEGLHPASAARDYDIIQGKGAKKSEAMLRDFLKAGGSVKWASLTDTTADATFSHPAGGEVRITWDMLRAETAGLKGKEMWKKYPRQMLRARCVSEGVRTVCPMATGGMYTPEEVQDMPEKDIGDGLTIDGATGQVQRASLAGPAAKSAAKAEQPAAAEHGPPKEPEGNASAGGAAPGEQPLLTDGERNHIKLKLEAAGLTEVDLRAQFSKTLAELTKADFKPVKDWVSSKA